MQVIDIRIERNYASQSVSDGYTEVTVAEPYWSLYINSEYIASTDLENPMIDFNAYIFAWSEENL